MPDFIGFDTSNYTTSAAVVGRGSDGKTDRNAPFIILNERIPLEVAEGGRGLRQSDALFAHTVNMPKLTTKLGAVKLGGGTEAVGCSVSPRDVAGSYMPCFLAGIAAASTCADLLGVPLYKFSHQAGHIAAALYGCGKLSLWRDGGEFLAWHVSGGTTELLHVKNRVIEQLGSTLDISAGKAIDRIGVTLGLHFPCGAQLEKLAERGELGGAPIKTSVSGCDFNLSGLENKAAELLARGKEPSDVALFTLEFIIRTLIAATENAAARFSGLPLICAGGVMSNKRVAQAFHRNFEASFAPPELSCDNAAGIALLTEMGHTGEIKYD